KALTGCKLHNCFTRQFSISVKNLDLHLSGDVIRIEKCNPGERIERRLLRVYCSIGHLTEDSLRKGSGLERHGSSKLRRQRLSEYHVSQDSALTRLDTNRSYLLTGQPKDFVDRTLECLVGAQNDRTHNPFRHAPLGLLQKGCQSHIDQKVRRVD